MDLSLLTYDRPNGTILIENLTPRQTVEAIKELIDQKQIDPMGVQSAHFSYKPGEGPRILFSKFYTLAPYDTLIVKTINLKNTEPEVGEFTDVECAIEIVKMLNLYVFDSIGRILKDPSNYVSTRGGKYSILIDKSGLFRFDTPYGGSQFFYT